MKYLPHSICSLACALLPLVGVAQSAAKPAAGRPRTGTGTIAVLAPPAAKPAEVVKKAPVPAKSVVKILTGYVLNEEGEPLAGATVTAERGETITTNADGQFVIQSTAATPVLQVSYAGYQELQLPINTLQPTTFRLDPIEDYERQLKKRSKAANKAYRKP